MLLILQYSPEEAHDRIIKPAGMFSLFHLTTISVIKDQQYCSDFTVLSFKPEPLLFLGFKAWDYFSWTAEMIREMKAKESIRDISTSRLRFNQHQQLLAEIEAREEMYNRVVQLAQSLLQEEKIQSKEVNRKQYHTRISTYVYNLSALL